ncbi:hypothetical protein Tco_0925273 [Tanacetum coccineum]|uniref:Uncharacterized protein n=1 Tax=Tanacetum coccineum TaxID=301880 RepID=A0ABQ5DDD5_9ASTR
MTWAHFGEETDKTTDLHQDCQELSLQCLEDEKASLDPTRRLSPRDPDGKTGVRCFHDSVKQMTPAKTRIFSFMTASRLKRDAVTAGNDVEFLYVWCENEGRGFNLGRWHLYCHIGWVCHLVGCHSLRDLVSSTTLVGMLLSADTNFAMVVEMLGQLVSIEELGCEATTHEGA